MKALYGIGRVVENLEQSIDSRHLENHCQLRRNGGEFKVTVPFHRFFHAPQEELNSSAVQLSNVPEIEHQPGPVRLKRGLQLPKKHLALQGPEALREMLHHYRFPSCHT